MKKRAKKLGGEVGSIEKVKVSAERGWPWPAADQPERSKPEPHGKQGQLRLLRAISFVAQ